MPFSPEAQKIYDRRIDREELVPPYELPDPLIRPDNTVITSAAGWLDERRRYLGLFESEMYGAVPPRPSSIGFEVVSEKKDALDGLATRREIAIHCSGPTGARLSMLMLLYLPNNAGKPVPAFCGLNFHTNAACTSEPDITLSALPHYETGNRFYDDVRATGDNRGGQAGRWCFSDVLKRGFASATMHYFEGFPDYPDGFGESVYKLFHTQDELRGNAHGFGAIGAWSWMLSRMIDYLETEPRVDRTKIIVHGHSRLGKTALWACANDSRAAMAVSNCSGCGGAAPSRRKFGETPEWLLYWRTYWFNKRWRDYINREEELPFDQNTLIALMAPRPVYVVSGTLDTDADPEGEFISASAAEKVYGLFGVKGTGTDIMPPPDTTVGDRVGYHVHTGPHDMRIDDWEKIMDFAVRVLNLKNT